MPGDKSASRPVIVKVGGSLFDLPSLGECLQSFLAELSSHHVVLVPGGGKAARAIRHSDRTHSLGGPASHWLALRAMTLNAHFLSDLLGTNATVVSGDVEHFPYLWSDRSVPILDAHFFAGKDNSQPDRLPYTWAVTSDSVAARLAVVIVARRLILIKSIGTEEAWTLKDLIERGIVDRYFATVLKRCDEDSIQVDVVNFRAIDGRTSCVTHAS